MKKVVIKYIVDQFHPEFSKPKTYECVSYEFHKIGFFSMTFQDGSTKYINCSVIASIKVPEPIK